MASDTSSTAQTTPAFPVPTTTSTSAAPEASFPPISSASSISSMSSSSSESDQRQGSRPSSRHSHVARPPGPPRQKSGSIIVPKDKNVIQRQRDYPPDDARAMSPKRNSRDLERLGAAARASLQDQARILQSSLAALAERIDEVKSDHDKLESENRFLQDYIGGLTRTMSQRDLGGSSGKGGKGKR